MIFCMGVFFFVILPLDIFQPPDPSLRGPLHGTPQRQGAAFGEWSKVAYGIALVTYAALAAVFAGPLLFTLAAAVYATILNRLRLIPGPPELVVMLAMCLFILGLFHIVMFRAVTNPSRVLSPDSEDDDAG